MHGLSTVAMSVALLNLPFGYWRAGTRKLSVPWFLAVHLPVPLVVGLRLWSGLGWRLTTVPWLAGAFFLGQFAGGVVRRAISPPGRDHGTRDEETDPPA